MARNPEALLRFHNNFRINLISRNIKRLFHDSFDGILMMNCTFHYFSSNRDKSLAKMLNNLRWMEEVAMQMERLNLQSEPLARDGVCETKSEPQCCAPEPRRGETPFHRRPRVHDINQQRKLHFQPNLQ